jgi:uncharacterized protein
LAEGAHKHCLLVLDVLPEPVLCPLELAATATIAEALLQGRRLLLQQRIDPAVDWEGATVGIWGVRQPRVTVPRDGDRIEVYRALEIDPRQRRRQRARTGRSG